MRTLGIVRRLVGCFYCGRPISKYRGRAEVCGYCSDLPLKDPLVNKARQPLGEAERMEAAKRRADRHDVWMRWAREFRREQERMKAAG